MKKDNSRLYSYISGVAIFLQLSLAGIPEPYGIITSGVLLTIASIFTIKKQRSSVEINKKATIFTWVLIAVAFFGGLNDLLQKMHEWNPVFIQESLQDWLRRGIAIAIGLLNMFSKDMFPTDEGSAIKQQKNELKQLQNFKQ